MDDSIRFTAMELGLIGCLSDLMKSNYDRLVDKIENIMTIDRENLCKNFENIIFSIASDSLDKRNFEKLTEFYDMQYITNEHRYCCDYHKARRADNISSPNTKMNKLSKAFSQYDDPEFSKKLKESWINLMKKQSLSQIVAQIHSCYILKKYLVLLC